MESSCKLIPPYQSDSPLPTGTPRCQQGPPSCKQGLLAVNSDSPLSTKTPRYQQGLPAVNRVSSLLTGTPCCQQENFPLSTGTPRCQQGLPAVNRDSLLSTGTTPCEQGLPVFNRNFPLSTGTPRCHQLDSPLSKKHLVLAYRDYSLLQQCNNVPHLNRNRPLLLSYLG
jgi:hypothetical protein